MSDKPVLSTGHLWALIRGSFSGNLPLPYVQEIFLLECHVAGTSHVNDINLIETGLSAGNFLMFKREPGNEHDPLAIMISDQKGRKLGYVPQAKNEVLARLMDAGKLVFGKIESLDRIEQWLKISIRVYMKDI